MAGADDADEDREYVPSERELAALAEAQASMAQSNKLI
jgi:hypothetical protein